MGPRREQCVSPQLMCELGPRIELAMVWESLTWEWAMRRVLVTLLAVMVLESQTHREERGLQLLTALFSCSVVLVTVVQAVMAALLCRMVDLTDDVAVIAAPGERYTL